MSPDRSSGRSGEQSAGKAGGKGFRPDIEGLRAIAIGLVLVYHAGVTFLPGGFVGVDVFFVLSGFLITSLLLREVERTGRVSLRRFYARRAKRLLPASALVLSVTAVLTWVFSSVVEWRTVGGDIVSASLYLVNWRLADRSVDYLAEDAGASPVQHFWSLAVEEQFYIVWPLLLVLVALVVRRTGVRLRPLMAVALTLIVVPSLAYSVIATAANPATAFFITPTRLWELGIGALVAVGAGLWKYLPRRGAAALGWAGLTAVLASGFLLDHSTPWPSAWALLPTLGTAALIIAGTHPTTGVAPLLATRPLVWIGGLSYSLYLWHWPLLITATTIWGDLGQRRGLLVVALSFIPAWLSYRFVENPVRFSPRLDRSNGLTLSLGINLTAVSVVAGLLLAFAVPSSPTNGSAPGAGSLQQDDGVTEIASLDSLEDLTPLPQDAQRDVPDAYARGCQPEADTAVPVYCEYGDPGGDTAVWVVGDSKALQWIDAIDAIGQKHGWNITTATKSGCAFADATPVRLEEPYENCRAHNDAVLAELEERQPDVVIVSQRAKRAYAENGEPGREPMVDALVHTWTQLEDDGMDVVVLMDNPSPIGIEGYGGDRVYACVAERLDRLDQCAFDRAAGEAESGSPVMRQAASAVPDVELVDMADVLCSADRCPPVIGDVLVYRQGSHITNTYVLSTESLLAERLLPLVESATTDSAR